jgi:hypothetical protein
MAALDDVRIVARPPLADNDLDARGVKRLLEGLCREGAVVRWRGPGDAQLEYRRVAWQHCQSP